MSMQITALEFALQNQQQWVVGVPNTGIQFLVQGPTMELQQANLRALATEMQQGAQGFEIDNLGSMLYLNGADPRQIYVGLFEDTNQIVVDDAVIYTCPQANLTIDDMFEEAGEALLALFA